MRIYTAVEARAIQTAVYYGISEDPPQCGKRLARFEFLTRLLGEIADKIEGHPYHTAESNLPYILSCSLDEGFCQALRILGYTVEEEGKQTKISWM
ncbi:MAG: hypothetical protein V1848_03735 [Candidatus Magasanikbacteria bacterium]